MYNVIVPDHEFGKIFVEPAAALYHSLRRLGAEPEYHVANILPQNGRKNIILAAQLWPTDLKDQIVWNFESVGCELLKGLYQQTLKQNKVLDWSKDNTIKLKLTHGIDALCLPMGYVPELTAFAPNPMGDCDIDVLFFGSMNERRQHIIDRMRARGLKVHTEYGLYGDKRTELMKRSKIVVNIKFNRDYCTETVRLMTCIANGVAVLSEANFAEAKRDQDDYPSVVFKEYELLGEEIYNGMDVDVINHQRLLAQQNASKLDMVDNVRSIMK